jgi:curved DNA-binding protein CbpA
MDLNYALELLELKTPYTKKELRKQYFKKALIYHPDKNNHENSNKQFTDIKDAYAFLENYLIYDNIDKNIPTDKNIPDDSDNYIFIIEKFIKMATIVDFNNVKEIIQLLYQNCQQISISTFERIDKSNALKLYAYMNQYSELLGIDEDTLEKFREIMKEKIENDELVILNPSLDNLLDSEIYILNHCEEIYYIPLWHDEVSYDNGENTLIVKCIPQLPSHIYIDEFNNIHINIKISIQKALQNKKITFNIGKKVFEIETIELKIIKQQTYIIKNKGISFINIGDSYDVNKKCDIIINLELY